MRCPECAGWEKGVRDANRLSQEYQMNYDFLRRRAEAMLLALDRQYLGRERVLTPEEIDLRVLLQPKEARDV